MEHWLQCFGEEGNRAEVTIGEGEGDSDGEGEGDGDDVSSPGQFSSI